MEADDDVYISAEALLVRWGTTDEDEGVQESSNVTDNQAAEESQVKNLNVRKRATSNKTSGKSKVKKQRTVETSSSVPPPASLPESLLTDSVAESATQPEQQLNQPNVIATGQAGKAKSKNPKSSSKQASWTTTRPTHLRRRSKANIACK